MQAIQTQYKKCHFRSRLEARWAVFFDSLRLPWEYGKEGFKLELIRFRGHLSCGGMEVLHHETAQKPLPG
jgi:hypothetical protein